MIPTTAWTGGKLSEPGCYSGVPLSLYHGDLCVGPSISSSGMRKLFSRSPAHFYAEWYGNPNREEQDDKEAFVLGRAAHHLLLSQQFFSREFVLRPAELMDSRTGEMRAWQGNRTDCKRWLDEQATAGKTVLTEAQIDTIKGMAVALGRHPLVQSGILNGQVERTIVWRDQATGVWIKCRPDAIPTDSGDFCDLKTTPSVEWRDLMRSYDSYGYHVQAALSRMACREVLGIDFSTFTLLFVENPSRSALAMSE